MTNLNKKRLALTTLLSSAVIGFAAAPTMAQAVDDEIVVTGTRIKQKNLVASSPVTSVSKEDFAVRGVTRVEDLVNELPQVFAGQGSAVSNGATGTATVNLRGLGASRTLVLLDGRRMGPGSVLNVAPDLNQIPAALIKTVDIQTGGSAAVYGSDAVAGVVNFVMDREFNGMRLDINASAYQHNNDNSGIQQLLGDSGNLTSSRTGNQIDGFAQDATLILGTDFDGDRGNITGYVGYRNVDAVVQADRDYSGCAFGGGTSGDFSCVGSFTTPTGTFTDPSFSRYFFTLDENNPNEFRNVDFGADTFNFNPTNYFQRPDERWTAGVFASYDVTDKDEAYLDFMYMDDRSVAQIAFSGNFFVTNEVSCDNPFLSDGQRAAICDPSTFNAGELERFNEFNVAPLTFGRRNVEGDPRQDDLRHTNHRFVGGMRGDFRLIEGFEYDVSASYSNVHLSENYLNEISVSRAQNALYATADANGNPTCRTDLVNDPTCVPINWFAIGGVTDEALSYVQGSGFQDGNYEQQVLLATIAGDLTDHGFQVPGTDSGAQIVLGLEYKSDDYELRTDNAFTTGDLAGQGGPSIGLAGEYDSYEVFGEIQLPLIDGVPGIEELTFNGAYRYADNSLSGGADSYAAGLIYQPTSWARLRGQYQRAVRVPNAIELFSAQSIGLFDIAGGDPCSGATPSLTAEQCARTGVLPGQYGNITANPAGQYNAFFGGNTELDPETSDTITLGAVLTLDQFVEGLTVSVDYFDIEVQDFVGTVPPLLAIENCAETGDEFFCSLVNRDPNSGSLWVNANGFVTATNVNTGSLATSGVDLNVNYSFEMPNSLGDMRLNFVGTWLESLETEPLPGEESFDCVGFYADDCGTPNPEWRHITSATWSTNYDTDITGTWRYFDGVKGFDGLGEGFPDGKLDATSFFDVAATYRGIEDVTLRFGVNNVLDSEPPLSSSVGAGFGNGNTFPQVYDSLGRYLFARATLDF